MVRADCGRGIVNISHSNRFLVAQTPDHHQPSGSVPYAPPILSTATAAKMHRVSCVWIPVGIESNPFLRGCQNKANLTIAYFTHKRAQPPKFESCRYLAGPVPTGHSVGLLGSVRSVGLRPLYRRVRHPHPMAALQPAVLHHLLLHRPMR